MSTIPASAVVNVIPNVLNAGGNALDVITVVLTKSWRVPIGTTQPFADPTDVGTFFGATSQEAGDATVYFNGFDNSSAKPGSILFVQYPATAVPAYLQSASLAGVPLSTIQALTGSLTVIIDGYTHTAASINLAGATSYSAAAALIQAGLTATEPTEASFTGSISGNTLTVSNVASGTLSVGQTLAGAGVTANTLITALGSGTGLAGTYTVSQAQTVASSSLTAVATAPTVTFDSVSGSLLIQSGITGTPSTATFATGTLATPLYLTQTSGAKTSQGAQAAVPGPFMTGVTQLTQNWALFMTAFDPDNGGGNAVKLAFAAWTSQQNNRYGYICWDKDVSPTLTVPATQSLGYLIAQNEYSGTCLIYTPSDLYHASFVCGTAASINFAQTNGRITFAFKHQVGLTAGVTNQQVAANLIANGYCFYGAYATANQGFVFFYNGSISGPFQWLDSYVNQIWLNNGLQLAQMELLTQINSIPYNAQGYALMEAACMDMINAGLNFGAIRAGVTLSQSQIAEINNAVGKPIDTTLSAQGWYLYIQDAPPQIREARNSPVFLFYYMDGESVQQITLDSTLVQ